MSARTLAVDMDVDFHNEDETGYVWAWLTQARDPGTIVHLEVLPGTVADYLDAVTRTVAISA